MTRRPSLRARRASAYRPALLALEGRFLLAASVGAGKNAADVLSYHDDNSRTGSVTTETTLTPATVGSPSFGKVGSVKVDGQVYGEPLYVQSLKMSDGKVHSVIFVATENDSVYAIDATNPKAGPGHNGILWHDSFVNAKAGITPVPSGDVGVDDITPNIGITGTPVIDPATNAMYLVAKTKVQQGKKAAPTYVQKLYALNLSNGRAMLGGPTTIGATTLEPNGTFLDKTDVSVPGTGAGSVDGVLKFNALREDQRSGLALDTSVTGEANGLIIVAYSSHGDINPYHGWLLGYDPRTMKLMSVFNTTPDGNFGAIWQGGAAPSIAPNGDILATTGNGTFDAFTSTASPGASALGDAGPGLGYEGLNNSFAVKFDAADPYDGVSGTGIYYGGTDPVTNPVAPSVDEPLAGTGINFNAAANAATPHTFHASLTYDGSSLSETLTDLTTGATYSHLYGNVNIPAAVGGTTAYVGFGGGDDGRHAIEDITNWTYTAGSAATPTIDHSAGFASNSDLTANGVASFAGTSARLTDGGGEEAADIFADQEVNIQAFATSFNFQFAPDPMADSGSPIADGITFIAQASNGHPSGQDYGESTLRVRPTLGTMTVVDSFTPTNYESLILNDQDPGSTATLLLPSFPGTAHPNLAVVAGKGGTIYLVDQSNLGGYSLSGPDRVIQEVNVGNGFFGSPSYLNGKVYYQAAGDVLRSFSLELNPATNTMNLVQDPATGADKAGYPGTSPATSSAGAADGIVWAVQASEFKNEGPAVLRAYDATNLAEKLFDSSASSANQAGGAVKFVTPTIANGRVYVGLSDEVDIYGLKTGTKAKG